MLCPRDDIEEVLKRVLDAEWISTAILSSDTSTSDDFLKAHSKHYTGACQPVVALLLNE